VRAATTRELTCGVWAPRAGGADAKKIQRRLGHARIRMTYALYGHLLPEADEEVASNLDSLFQCVQPPPEAAVVELR
jgi:integrase